jgi:hypothetical protein
VGATPSFPGKQAFEKETIGNLVHILEEHLEGKKPSNL